MKFSGIRLKHPYLTIVFLGSGGILALIAMIWTLGDPDFDYLWSSAIFLVVFGIVFLCDREPVPGKSSSVHQQAGAAPGPQPQFSPVIKPRRPGHFIICPNQNCGYQGPCEKEPKGSTIVLIFLFFLWVLPGLLYLIAAGGYRLKCPKCGLQISG